MTVREKGKLIAWKNTENNLEERKEAVEKKRQTWVKRTGGSTDKKTECDRHEWSQHRDALTKRQKGTDMGEADTETH